ncbi:hypothetical protein M501DRAFT_987818 [Patellaria atrata CBS 101060]|uniref:Mechanosensitive ion channel protein n=1 Tax=Patellaria atrata CBS 101060 TaxID=1346257 RepID=A0A9P4S428_9PEZI|nr:hypothetical protein M501DRAFT_987818 [Patellaria atrata CBS 101060]
MGSDGRSSASRVDLLQASLEKEPMNMKTVSKFSLALRTTPEEACQLILAEEWSARATVCSMRTAISPADDVGAPKEKVIPSGQVSIPSSTIAADSVLSSEKKATGLTVSTLEIQDGSEKGHNPFHHFRGRRRISDPTAGRKEEQQKIGYDGEEDTVNKLGRIYKAILDFHLITRYAVYILPVSALLAIPIAIFATIHSNARADGIRLLGLFIWLQIIWISLWVGKLIAKMVPYIFTFFCGIVSSGTRKYRLILVAIEVPISLLAWAVVAWATVPVIKSFDKHRPNPEWINTLRRVILASICVAACFVFEKVIVQLVGINYHRKQFNARIHASKHKVRLLDAMYEESRRLFPTYCSEFMDEDYTILTGLSQGSLLSRSSSAPLKIINNIGRAGETVTSAFGNMASEITGGQVAGTTAAHSIVIEALEMKTSTEALARRLWMSFVAEGHDALYQKDIEDIFGSGRLQEAEDIFATLDADCNGDISMEEMVITVVEIARERKAIARSMHDVNQAVRVLDRFLGVIVLIAVGMIYAAFFSSGFAKYMATIGTQIAAVSFALAGTAQEFLGSCIFLFVKHPYDVGDTVLIDKTSLIVEHISLLYTTFRRLDSNRTVQIPNIVNNTMWIENITRSQAMKEQISLAISPSTSNDDIDLLKREMQHFVLSADNKRDFNPAVEIELLGVGDMTKLELRLEVTHKSNWANEPLRAARRNKLMTALLAALRAVPIYPPAGGDAALGDYNRPAYSVAVSETEAAEARKKFAADKEAKRLVPTVQGEAEKATDAGISSGAQHGLRPADLHSRPVSRSSMESRREGRTGLRKASQAEGTHEEFSRSVRRSGTFHQSKTARDGF